MEGLLIPLVVVATMSSVMLRQQNPKRLRMPWVTLAIFAVTLVVGAIAVFDDTVLDAIRRDSDELASGEWWRLISPLVGQDGGLSGLLFNLVTLLGFGAIVENLFGWRLLLITYFAAGLASEIAAYTIMPGQGYAGNSVAVFGLVGLICVSALVSAMPARLIGGIATGLGLLLLVLWDLHGIGFAVGVTVALVRWFVRRPRSAAAKVRTSPS